MNPYYDIVRLMRSQKSNPVPFAEGTIHVEPVTVEIMGETASVRFASQVGTTTLYEGATCLVYMGTDENVVVAVW